MADNVPITAGSGTSIATDDVGGVHYQLIKLGYGALDAFTIVTTSAGLPVAQQGTWNITNAGMFAVQVDGTALTRLTDIETNTDACAVVGNGAAATAQRVTLANDSTGIIALTTSTASIGKLAANSGVDIGDVDVLTINGVAPAFGSGVRGSTVQRVTVATDDVVPASQSGTWTVQPGNTANTTPWLVTQTPGTTGGLTTYHLISAGSTNATNIKASAGQVYGWFLQNNASAIRKVAFHNTSGTPTAGSSVFFSLTIPAGAAANVSFPNGIPFSTGIAITTVTGQADSDATAVTANDLNINIFYK